MRNNIAKIIPCVFLIVFARAQDRGIITGTVVDEGGSPVAKAKVHIAEKGVLAVHRLVKFYETDAAGRFRIAQVPWGTYILMVGKEDADHPDTQATFYSGSAIPTAVVTEQSPTVDVTLKLGPKAGVLELEPVTDAITGREIRSAAIRLKRAENPGLFIYTSTTQHRFLVPPLTEVLIEISAEGYKSWPLPERSAEGRLFLHPEQIQKLQVTLQPKEPGSTSSESKPD